ncbi:probable inactive ATP-dependent zinc metalloprotease FTSHI 1, chloroplastic [Phalaenopsis equestris]|uniref:probable inactive ATP-dependent zinc metalloprotease FTSHI 1, chloroplastic n=1 Tax=Phalaenopsis equestris TaxID=78828 RepID=UPI0009E60D76|nr:probable inactive ATP-dependent zinc metalloprotease FTSHI 1, chloroplastic [Phalaenopsis equestris]
MSAGSFLLSSRVPLPKSFPPDFTWSQPNSLLLRSKPLSTAPLRGSYVRAATAAGGGEGDFISKVLKENPTQVEPKFLVGERFLTLRDKHGPGKPPVLRISQLVKRLLGDSYGSKGKCGQEGTGECMNQSQNTVYLKDILREFKGQLYVPEEVFMENLSEEEVFDRDIHELPLLSFEDFQKHLTAGKIKQLTSKSMVGVPAGVGYRDFIVDLIETPGDKNLQKTRWAIRLSAAQTQAVYEEYKGARYEIEKQMRSYVGKLAEYPHPVASSISSRIMVEFGMVTALMAAFAAVIAGFMASAAFAVTSFSYATIVYVLWPLARPFLKLGLGIVSNIAEGIWEYIVDIYSDGGFFSKMHELYTFGGVSASLEVLKPILLVFVTMVLLVRYTLSRRPKNFRKWDIWQGIEFGQSKPQARVDGSTGVTFKDVAGIDEAVDELQELVRYLKNPDLFDKMGIKPPHGVLLEGPPGCGKTLVAKAIAGEAGVPFYQMAGSEFVEVLVGVGSARIRDLFKRAKVNKPSVIFIDEIDALATRRQGIFKESTNHLYNAATQERETTLNQLLIELDGFDTGKGVIFLGATNRRDLLDPALLRPGRFDRKIRIRPPGAKGRLDILKVHARQVKLSPTVDLASYAQNLPGWTGAKLAQLMQEAALVAVRNKHESVFQSDMDEAVDRLTIGPKKVVIELGHQGQCRRAITEVGVAITSHLLRRYENAKVEYCERISIIPRGQTLSQIVFHRLDEEFYMFEKRPQLLHRLQVLLGGRAAEEVIFGRDTSKASLKYLEDATCLARKILTIWNLENPMTIHGEPFPWKRKAQFVGPRLDFEGSLYVDYDFIEPPINFDLDDQVARRTEELIHDMYGKTLTYLRHHFTALLKTVKVLLDKKEISGDHIEFILDNYPAMTPARAVLEEKDPGSLPFFVEDGGRDLVLTSPIPDEAQYRETIRSHLKSPLTP